MSLRSYVAATGASIETSATMYIAAYDGPIEDARLVTLEEFERSDLIAVVVSTDVTNH